jgi:hypothetical protein
MRLELRVRSREIRSRGRMMSGYHREPLFDAVIPGWSEGPDHRCAIAHRGISRFRVRC